MFWILIPFQIWDAVIKCCKPFSGIMTIYPQVLCLFVDKRYLIFLIFWAYFYSNLAHWLNKPVISDWLLEYALLLFMKQILLSWGLNTVKNLLYCPGAGKLSPHWEKSFSQISSEDYNVMSPVLETVDTAGKKRQKKHLLSVALRL